MRVRSAAAVLWLLLPVAVFAAETDSAARRVLEDFNAGKPLVAHVIVALADNEHQGIVPIPSTLGDGDRPQSNLYWGAMYGVKGFSAKIRCSSLESSKSARASRSGGLRVV